MRLHTFVGSPNGRKVEAVIDHLGLSVEIVHHDFPGGLLAPGYIVLNPNAMAPTLVDGTFALWESTAIMQYLADKAGDDALFPRDPRRRADVVRWQCWELTNFNRAFSQLAFEFVAKPQLAIEPGDPAFVEAACRDLARFAPVLDHHMADHRYLVGDGLTIADYSMIVFEAYRLAVPFDWTPYPNLNAYFDRARTADAWVRTAPARPGADDHKSKVA